MNLKHDKVLSLIGIAMKAGKAYSGDTQTLEAVKKGTACLVILAGDASANTRKKFSDKCSFYEVNIRTYATKELLGGAIGKEERSTICICDEGLSNALLRELDEL